MDKIKTLKDNIAKVMIGNEHTIELVLTCILAQGHILLEDVPGTGKTVMSRVLARSVNAKFGRVQFTPDLLPSDVTGLNYFDSKSGEFVFSEGPVFCNILLADEINRATPKTQSSLLECMAEHQVTIDKETRILEEPFFVIATQNPLETLGTFPLPEAQMDRFMMQLSMENLSETEELSMLKRFLAQEPLSQLEAIMEKEELIQLQKKCREVYIHEDVQRYMIQLIQTTRKDDRIQEGVSPRGTLSLAHAAQGYAMVQGRDYVVPEDIKAVAIPVLAHRLHLLSAMDDRKTAQTIITDILSSVPVPTEDWTKR